MKIFLLLSIFSYQVESVEIICDFNEGGQCYNCIGYHCDVQNTELVTSIDDRTITKVNSGKSPNDVKGFWVRNKNVKFFPRGITKFFNNIENLSVEHCDLKNITKEDLKEFGDNLKKLWLYNTEIEVVESDLFEYNQNLIFIDFEKNLIKLVGDDAFNGLRALKNLRLNNNPCTTGKDFVTNNSFEVLRLITNVKRKCKDLNDETLKKFEDFYQPKFSLIEQQIASVMKLIEGQSKEILDLKQEISTIESKFELALTPKLKLRKRSSNFEGKLKQKFSALESNLKQVVKDEIESLQKSFKTALDDGKCDLKPLNETISV